MNSKEKRPYTGRQIFQRVLESGFDGGVTIVTDYVRKVRPPKTKPFLKLVFAPGECAQVDFRCKKFRIYKSLDFLVKKYEIRLSLDITN